MSSPAGTHAVPRKPVPAASEILESAVLSTAPSHTADVTEVQDRGVSTDGYQRAALPDELQNAAPPASETSSIQRPMATKSRIEKQPHSQKSTFPTRMFNIGGPWRLELWSTILTSAAFAAIVVVLAYYDAKLQTRWPYTSLTLNGLVALLVSIARASLLVGVTPAIRQGKWNRLVGIGQKGQRVLRARELCDFERFDDASRGAWGALQLLVRKSLHLASLGAITTIRLLGFDTFAQQILAIRFRDDVAPYQSGLPVVARSECYDPSHFITQTSDYPTVGDLKLKSDVYNGIMNQNQTQLPLTCSTGNCTWPVIPTVAVCGACVDLTANITEQCSDDCCNYTLPNGASLDGRISDIPLSELTARRNFFRLWSPFVLVPLSRTWTAPFLCS
ncbi:hypothetical protein G647_07446 [Cladophialophora carrionii CBS 160.54]|uniref:Uncharacterized protein n=1 Tax=Cladophialophora carrionii CBS 160.54 TaxID=1279043 RepID=V9D518_9EURO|nr:uncharacterized protein G647_07446 [Cladophialophora carrionii CBS 160.54]ETI21102.1 hypothetical protein G647_07446 [Cladophialophora carrionii CBS 160.54]